jgi:EAL domain-containing protein (putative c-di-GMP-specific phosphodiesterase class I)
VGDHGRFAFEPILNLVHGRPVGMEAVRLQARDQTRRVAESAVWGARQLAEFDSGIAIAAALHGSDYDGGVPLHVDVLADTVVVARRRVRELRASLHRRAPHRPAPTVVLEIGPALAAAPADALVEGVAELRADGFLVALDGAGRGFGLDLVADLAPDLVKVEGALVERLPDDPRARSVVAALCDVCRTVGVRVSATGVRTTDQLAAVREQGIPWGQGPLLAGARRRPSAAGVGLPVELLTDVAPALHGRPAPAPRPAASEPGVAALGHAPVALPEDVTAELVRQALADQPQAGGVVLLDAHRRPTGFLDRNRFMLAISGPYGRALYAGRPARSLADPPRTVPVDATVRAALAVCASGARERTHDDLVLVAPDGTCAGVVRVADLFAEAAGSAA